MWAITTFGVGRAVTARAIKPDWDLAEGEAFKVEVWEPGMIWDGVTVRHPTEQELEETSEQTIKRLEGALDRHLDAVANSYRYTDIARMAGYAGDPDPQFDREGTAAKNWRSAVYRQGINKIIACTREVDPDPIPTEEELIASMPIFETFLQP